MDLPADIACKYPTGLREITLGQWIFFTNSCKDLDAQLVGIQKLEESRRKNILLTSNQVARAYQAVIFFGDIDIDTAHKDVCVDSALNSYAGMMRLFDQMTPEVQPFKLFNRSWLLPFPELSPASAMTFGEFIDSKVIAQSAAFQEQSKWELLQYVCAIFLRKPKEEYNEAFVDENSSRFKLMADLPMNVAVSVLTFFEDLNRHIEEYFTVFHESGQKEGKAMAEHFQQWGWVNFLKSIAKTKVFDIPNSGLNSIECARKAKCYDVLIYASEEKDYNVAMGIDMEAMYKK